MNKKIQKYMLLLVLISILLFSLGTNFLFYDTQKNQAIEIVKNQAALLKPNVETFVFGDDYKKLEAAITKSRITIIDKEGVVIYDNKIDPSKLDNHNDRQEVKAARTFGFGEEERYSDSFLNMFYYYAMLLDNDLVLRVSVSIDSLYSHIYRTFPFTFITMLIIIAVSMYISRKLTKNIIEPIEKADLKSNLKSPYVELDKYFTAMREQKSAIECQMIRVNKRNETINTILNTMQEGFMIVDKHHNVVLANQALLEIINIFNYTYGDSVYRFISDRKLIMKVNDALVGKSSKYKIEINQKTYRVYISHSQILQEDVAILLFVDISSEMENQKYREQFSANVSHELKTPLTSIKGLAELLANNLVESEDVGLFGEKILKQSNRLLELIDHIIRLSKFDEDVIEIENEQVDMKKLLDDVLFHLQKPLLKKNIELSLNVEEISLLANYQMLDELLYNLIDNAIKYNDEGGWIKIDIKVQNDIIIEISNSGQKISSDEISRVFERFYRVDSSRNRKTGGSGLGLSIVKHIVLHYQGNVEVSSDNYTTFRITLPKDL